MDLAEWLDDTDAMRALDAAHDAAWTAVDAELLALCRNRTAMLLRHTPTIDALSDHDQATLSSWTTSDTYTDRERAALDFTEQYIIDVASITNGQADALGTHLGNEGLATFVNALLVVEQRMTLELALTAVLR